MTKAKLIELLNQALELEHQAEAQYLSHATLLSGEAADTLTDRLKEIAGDEHKHAEQFRACLEILDAAPSIKMAPGHPAKGNSQILKVNLKDERDAVDFYRTIMAELQKSRAELPYEYEFIEHKVRHIIMDEEEHALELRTLIGE
ncbi:MAG TPA: ferritin-like domain-containing protein [Candidatus Bilamarchaeaceae archaeon]|nr:ferritin-like domain-containing protein [Candidatus Bilamarchaeaceae archaeon]